MRSLLTLFRFQLLLGLACILTVDAAAQSVTEMRVMSYNIRYKNTIDSINGWDYRRDNVAALMEYHQADIAGLQEATLVQIEDLEARMPAYKWYGVPRTSASNGEYTPIFYRADKYLLLDSGSFWYSETPHVKESKSWDAMYPRIASWCKFREKATGTEFFFFNTHFDHIGEIARQKSAEILRSQMNLVAKQSPIITTGDFNAQPSTIAYQNMVKDKKIFDALDLSVKPHYGPVNTASGFSVSSNPIKARIDYIFVNSKIKVLQHATLTDQQEGRYYSDHLPIIAVLELSR